MLMLLAWRDVELTTLDTLHKMIAQDENTRVEFKREASDSVLQSMSTSLAAMSNAQGGTIIFGVTDKKDPAGCVLKGNERDRISQEASNCQPIVRVEFEEVPFGNRTFLLVKVPRSKLVHNDIQRKFPVRVGNITGYLDAYGLISLLQERGLVYREGQQPQELGVVAQQERAKIPAEELTTLSRSLESSDRIVRREALRDLTANPFKYIVLEDQSVAKLIERFLDTGDQEEQALALDLLRYVANWGNAKEKRVAGSWMTRIAKIGVTATPEIARRAFDVLQSAGRREAVDILVHWVRNSDDDIYAKLQPANMVTNISHYGLRTPLRQALYDLLEKGPDERTRKRALEVLNMVRQAY